MMNGVRRGGKMYELGTLRLKQLLDLFPRISELALGNPKLEKIEVEFKPLSRGEEEFSLKHVEILKDEEHKYWRFLNWWRMPTIGQTEINGLKAHFKIPRPNAEIMIKSLFEVLKNIEIVSCILRFTDPVSFGIMNPSVENLLNVRGNAPWEKYSNYIEALRKLRIEYGFARNADVDMALWTLAHILNSAELRNSDRECKEIVDKYYKRPNPIKRIAAKNSLEQFLDEKDYLNIADMFVESDHAIAAFIAGREIERYLRKLCIRQGHKITEVGPDGFERNKSVSTMLNDLVDIFGREDRHQIKAWYRRRGDLVHDKKQVTTDEVNHIITGLRQLKERRLR
jgi:hypothetical protein